MSYAFCPRCGNPARPQEHDRQIVPICTSAACGFVFWQNSKPCASLLIEDERGRLLFGIRGIDPFRGKLDLPGGFLHHAEHPFDGARREAREELSVEVEIVGVLGFVMDTYDGPQDATLNIGVYARIASGELCAADDVAALAWLDPRKIAPQDLAFRNNQEFLAMHLARRSESSAAGFTKND
jgi:ADP-ribose pyrophosphatase YjhB (NUDIX family)